jgi:glycolate oxidase FAD binding subunit
VPQWVLEPGSADEIAYVLRYAGSARLCVAPRGSGTKMGWGNPPRAVDLILSTRRLDHVLEHAWADMTATVEAGCKVADVQRVLAEHGQRLAIDPLWPEQATIGGILATNDSGPLRGRFGSLRDLIIGMTAALPDGTLAKSGGKVVKNVAGYDLPKLFTGSLGTLGVITEATFRLHPLPQTVRSVSFSLPTVAAVNELVLKILDSTLIPTGVQVRVGAPLAQGAPPQPPTLDVRLEGIPAAVDTQLQQLAKLASAEPQDAPPPEVWSAREALWGRVETGGVETLDITSLPHLVCKLSVLPSHLGRLCEAVLRVATPLRLHWQIVAQAVGVGLLRLDGQNEQALLAALGVLRAEVEGLGGSLVVLQCSPEVKARVDVWGTTGDALPIMRRVKEQFDPAAILNPGRFVGGI